jgi:glycosyltransferase involved in cell wall biosynthesis
MELITFIIPTIGRPTLLRTVQSIQHQTLGLWKAVIVFDGMIPTINLDDERIQIISVPKCGLVNYAGQVRNEGIKLATTPWIGFVDDDDILSPDYIQHLQHHIKQQDPEVVIFRMYGYDKVYPPHGAIDFYKNQVGISFCLQRDLCTRDGVWFVLGPTEDFDMLDQLRNLQKRIFISPHITYYIRP